MNQKERQIDKKWWVALLLYLITTIPAHAQQIGQIRGTVVDQDGRVLEGVTVVVRDTSNRRVTTVTTTANGLFSIIGVTVGERYSLRFSLVGYQPQERADVLVEAGDHNSLLVRLSEQATDLDEVIVTALGIKRDEKALGYAQQTVNSEQLSTAVSTNWSEGLKGKVAGLNIISGSTGPINSQSIQLRGTTSLDPGGNYALIVIDGVPMNTKVWWDVE